MTKPSGLFSNLILLPLVLLLPYMLRCQGKTSDLIYELDKPHIIILSQTLKEISGIVVSGNHIYAVSDDKGELYKLDMDTGKILGQWRFGKADDYEDVAIVNNRFYVLNSNGDIISFPALAADSLITQEFEFPFGKGNEFEILYYDESSKQLVMICKECRDDNKEKLTVYTINPSTGNYAPAAFSVEAAAVARLNNSKPERLKPSAAAIHPTTGEVYIISSINKMLIRMDRAGKALSVYPLKRALFEQPEGITFTPEGDLLISNEAGEKGRATILLFKNNAN